MAAVAGEVLNVSNTYWPNVFALNSTDIYFVSNQDIFRKSLSGGVPALLASTPNGSTVIVLDATHIYFADYTSADGSMVKRVPLAGGTAETLTKVPGKVFEDLAVDSKYIYINDSHEILRVRK